MSLKTTENDSSVLDFIDTIEDANRRDDCLKINALLEKISGEKGKMWGASIVGYGKYSYTRSDNKFYKFLAIGFSPRKAALTIYNLPGYESHPELMDKLGKYKNGKSCLYIKQLSDIDINVLEKILTDGFNSVVGKHLDYKTNTWQDTK